MKELTKVRDAVVQALTAAGLPAMAAFTAERAREWPHAVAAVSVGAAEGSAMGFCNYLGEVWDAEAGTVREVYGKQLEAVILVDVRADRAADCESGCETAAEVLLGEERLPVGIKTGELAWAGLGWEKETGMFLRRGRLQCRAVFVAQEGEDGETFLDFQLKGVLAHE